MKGLPKISEAEWQVMKIIWNKPKVTSNEIINILKENSEWKSTTIKTLISRLLKKDAIGFEKNGKEYYYYALICEKDCVKEESENFLNRFFNGSLNSMLVNFVQSEKLSKTDIDELRKILDKTSQE